LSQLFKAFNNADSSKLGYLKGRRQINEILSDKTLFIEGFEKQFKLAIGDNSRIDFLSLLDIYRIHGRRS